MTDLWESLHKPDTYGYKPLDFGSGGVTGSVDRNGRIIALNCYHPLHGYVTLTSALPFPESERYNPAAVRAYRRSLVNLEGFGFQVDSEGVQHYPSLRYSSIPSITLSFPSDGDGETEVMTFARAEGVIQLWQMYDMDDTPLIWNGQLSLQRCAYTQLTEGGPIPIPPIETHACFKDGLLTIENPALEWAVAIVGLPAGEDWEQHTNGPIQIHLKAQAGDFVLAYGVGPTVEIATANALRLAQNSTEYFEQVDRGWNRLNEYGDDLVLQRGLSYSLMMAVPVDEGICFLTDHMILPLSWNRDSYYTARALLDVNPETNDLVRRHLIWLFEQAERRDGAWGRCYLANGQIKDGAFQLDQQLFPLLELAEYVLETNDQATYERLKPHIAPLLEGLHRRQRFGRMLFPTDETPADDPIALPYHLSSHILFWRVAALLSRLGVASMKEFADVLRKEIDRTFIAYHNGERMYAYATDGDRKYHFYHDANDIPLALMPVWGLVSPDDRVWRATVDFAFSEDNVGGFYNGRLGSVHTKAAWALGDIQDLIIARTIGDSVREQRAWDHLREAAQWDGALPEAYDPETGEVVSRHWFAWPNAALVCVERGVLSK